jgi:hypothetical protein
MLNLDESIPIERIPHFNTPDGVGVVAPHGRNMTVNPLLHSCNTSLAE